MPTDNSYTQSNIQDSVHTHHAGPIDDDGNVRCYRHQLVAELRTSNTDKNPERWVYAQLLPNPTLRLKLFLD